MDTAAKIFFSMSRFAVAGASANPSKFGYKILAWYDQHSLPVTALNPGGGKISLAGRQYHAVPSLSRLPEPAQTALSVVTPPQATRALLAEAHEVGVPAVWLQPGTFDESITEYARKHFAAAVFGAGGHGADGWCVLVDGENALAAAGVSWTARL